MKGMVFTLFLDMVEEVYGFDMVDTIIEDSNIPSEGVYTAVGTYPHTEMVSLLRSLEKEISIPIPELLKTYGTYLFSKLAGSYPKMVDGYHGSKELLKNLHGVIHVEVRKLYPDAELPRFDTVDLPNGNIEMHYYSERHLEHLAEGLLTGCLQHYNEKAEIKRTEREGIVVFTVIYQ